MESLYTYCAAIGGMLLVGQFLLSLVGIGEDHAHDFGGSDGHGDVHGGGDHEGTWFTGMLSFRAIVSGVTVFGLAGRAAFGQFDPLQTFGIATVSGGAMMYGVGWLLRMMYQLKSDGTAHIERSLGQAGSVYLTIPGARAGEGKITVNVQGRSMEYTAVTRGEELKTGTPVVVVNVISPGIVEVAREAPAAVPANIFVEGDAHV